MGAPERRPVWYCAVLPRVSPVLCKGNISSTVWYQREFLRPWLYPGLPAACCTAADSLSTAVNRSPRPSQARPEAEVTRR
eukprot:1108993-Rhodomonas_salina.1